jgi:AcrR family transcriptional regulator
VTVTDPKPVGKDEVVDALVDAAIELIVSEGMHVSVRRIADAAGVNHGLVHTYFGSKQGLLVAAFDEINRRAAAEIDAAGFPPPDLANRRNGELAKAMARYRLDTGSEQGPFSSHPIVGSWREALAASRPSLASDQIDAMVASAAALALGWAMFSDHLCDVLGLDDGRRSELDEHIAHLVADLGGLP